VNKTEVSKARDLSLGAAEATPAVVIINDIARTEYFIFFVFEFQENA
jgi:hypothetical protein